MRPTNLRCLVSGSLLACLVAALPAVAQTPAARPQPAPAGAVRPTPSAPTTPPPPNFVTLRTGFISFAADGTPMSPMPGGSSPVWLWDLFGVGMAVGQLDFMFHFTAQNIAPQPYEFSALYARTTVGWRPLRTGRLRFADPYVFGGASFGWAGAAVKRDTSCVDSNTVRCEYDRSGGGGGPQAGVGIDFNFPLTTFATGQQLLAFVAFETRAELFFHQGPQLFWVYSLPIGLRLQ